MIHDFKPEFFDLPLHEYTLTFDDGLYSQYYYWDDIKTINTDKIFFITTGILHFGERYLQEAHFPSAPDAHKSFFKEKVSDNYMTLKEIEEISDGAEIGGHGHYHLDLRSTSSLLNVRNAIVDDTTTMMNLFKEYFGISPTSFCFPYNYEHWAYKGLLKSLFGFERFYGGERIKIEDLM